MKRMLMVFCFLAFSFSMTALPQQSHAKLIGFNLDATLGGNYKAQFGNPDPQDKVAGFGTNIELMPSFQFLLVSADLGILYDFLHNEVMLRPGVRFWLGWFYLRVAIPVAYSFKRGLKTGPLDLGVLLGAGIRIGFGKFSLLAEANASPFLFKFNPNGVSMPVELRLGVSYSF